MLHSHKVSLEMELLRVAQGAVGLVTGESVDVLSHCAVRARNAGVLFASCQDVEVLEGLRQLAGGFMRLSTTAVSVFAGAFGQPNWRHVRSAQ